MVDDKYRKRIEEIMAPLSCSKDFECAKCGFDSLCKAKDVGLESMLECMEHEPRKCEFSVPFGNVYYCRCPLRVYLAKRLGK